MTAIPVANTGKRLSDDDAGGPSKKPRTSETTPQQDAAAIREKRLSNRMINKSQGNRASRTSRPLSDPGPRSTPQGATVQHDMIRFPGSSAQIHQIPAVGINSISPSTSAPKITPAKSTNNDTAQALTSGTVAGDVLNAPVQHGKSAHTGHTVIPPVRGSIGDKFDPPPQVDSHFKHIVSQTFAHKRGEPSGIPSEGNQCFRNALLSALINSDRFDAYVQGWHIPSEYRQISRLQRNRSHLLHHLCLIRSSADIGQAALRDTVIGSKGAPGL